MAQGDITTADVYGRIRNTVRAAGSQRAFAKQLGVSEAFISAVISGVRPPTEPILRAVKLKRVVKYEEVA
jgi:DNA-binding transcriptional regulator YdaS (Cro superfamily)